MAGLGFQLGLAPLQSVEKSTGLYFVLHSVNSNLEKENYYFLQCKTHCRLRFRKSSVSPVVWKWCVRALIFSSDAKARISDSAEIICKTHSCV